MSKANNLTQIRNEGFIQRAKQLAADAREGRFGDGIDAFLADHWPDARVESLRVTTEFSGAPSGVRVELTIKEGAIRYRMHGQAVSRVDAVIAALTGEAEQLTDEV